MNFWFVAFIVSVLFFWLSCLRRVRRFIKETDALVGKDIDIPVGASSVRFRVVEVEHGPSDPEGRLMWWWPIVETSFRLKLVENASSVLGLSWTLTAKSTR